MWRAYHRRPAARPIADNEAMPSLPKPGRPMKFTPQIAERLEFLASLGFDDDDAARQVGIGRTTLYRWLNDPRPAFREWQARMVRAEASAEVSMTLNMLRRSKTDWRVAWTWLKTHHPDRFPRFPGGVSPRGPRRPRPTGRVSGQKPRK